MLPAVLRWWSREAFRYYNGRGMLRFDFGIAFGAGHGVAFLFKAI